MVIVSFNKKGSVVHIVSDQGLIRTLAFLIGQQNQLETTVRDLLFVWKYLLQLQSWCWSHPSLPHKWFSDKWLQLEEKEE